MAAEPKPSAIDWLAVQTALEKVRNGVVKKEMAVHLIKQELHLDDTVYSLLQQFCRNEIKVDDVVTQLMAALHLAFLGKDEEWIWKAAKKMEEVLGRSFRTTQLHLHLHRKTFDIKKVMGVQDTVQETVESVANGKIEVDVAVVHLREFMLEREKQKKNRNE